LQKGIGILRSYFCVSDGGRSSMVEPQIVVLVVAGSSPVGHPALQIQIIKLQPAWELQFVHFPKKALPRSFLPQLEEAHSAPKLASWFVPGILTVFDLGENNGW
jgi:hypothetical protein